MSPFVSLSAVAVSAMMGTPGNSSRSCPSCVYSGRKSWPQFEMQWASSMAKSEMRAFCSVLIMLPTSRSGEM